MRAVPQNFREMRAAAKARLPRGVFEYIDRGSEDEKALDHNRTSFEALKIAPRMMRGAAPRSQGVEIFGKKFSSPVIVAPTAFAGLVWYKGEIELARAAKDAGIGFCAATEAITSIDEICGEAGGNIWFQLYLWQDRSLSQALLERAWNNGVRTLVVTVDTPVFAKREFNVRNGFIVPFRFSYPSVRDAAMRPGWLLNVFGRYVSKEGLPTFANYPREYRQDILNRTSKKKILHEQDLNWNHIRDLRAFWKGNLVLKGILRPDDAILAAEHGADGIVVSNHGGRNLDSAVAPLDVLGRNVDASGDRLVILSDSGIQRGSDLFKSLALGAKAVMVGRAFLYGTAMNGRQGALRTFRILEDELDRTMGLSGCRTIPDVTADLLYR
ncbi:alpha-hydroxy-acid oxidizing enzyme [Mesorhizobium sanjuanii]|uniref:Alpha-hydroxy-acid oxidizing enzyme n=1 Tax=Mesorhizobium sanjuanii TaxID=2037900 RepID=A0A2A6FLE8_9HYPH|nr:alpha-hydroxy-acid oxidizing enzyme [Mesorhizobium sanjuanii]